MKKKKKKTTQHREKLAHKKHNLFEIDLKWALWYEQRLDTLRVQRKNDVQNDNQNGKKNILLNVQL